MTKMILFKLDEELEAITALENGLRNKDHVLNICRLMVRAEDPEHRITILKCLQVCLCFLFICFVEYHLYCKKKLNLKKKTFTFANKVYEAILSYGIVS